MSTYFTKQEARDAASRQVRRLQKSASVILNEATVSVNDSETFDVFLSHSVRDADLIAGIKTILEEKGLKVYVDWIDDKALDRSKVTPETADLLRKRMKQSNCLLYIATENSGGSKWMPWELGFFDGHKNGQVAIIPVLDSPSEAFLGQEYLGLYPVVDKDTYKSGGQDVFVESARMRKFKTLKEFALVGSPWRSYSP